MRREKVKLTKRKKRREVNDRRDALGELGAHFCGSRWRALIADGETLTSAEIW